VTAGGGRLRAMLYEWGAVSSERATNEGGWSLQIVLSDARWNIFRGTAGYSNFVFENKSDELTLTV
jgi:hypothetical protein